ncbi:MAG: efflux RND transporter periplasmic adaptor subunit [Deltaproteobacteria bacterium]|nr:efflux RND transporter periplasmic adaptor subunit [Deltaproteobacteria bacterium]
MRRWLLLFGGVAVVVGATVALRRTVLAPALVAVEVAEVGRGRVEQTLTNSRGGTVKAHRRARLSPEVGGRVVTLTHREGETVALGELLLALDDSILRAQLALARAEGTAAKARQEQACVESSRAAQEVARNRSLAARAVIAADLLEGLEAKAAAGAAACLAAAAEVERAAAQVEVVESTLAQTRLRAPFAGSVARQTIEVGEWATPSPPAVPVAPVIELIDAEPRYIAAPMDEVDAAKLAVGQSVAVTLDPYPGQSFPAHLTRVAAYVLDVEQQNRTVEIEVRLDDAAFAARLLPGTSADVEVVLGAHDEVVRIPTPALVEGGRVLVIGDDDRLVARTVIVGLRNWDFVEISSGLAVGERVVTSLDRAGVAAGVRVQVASP